MSSSEWGGFAQCPGSCRTMVGRQGHAVWCLHLEREQRHHKMPPKQGLVRGCGGGMGAHRPCSSSRKLNENKKNTLSPTQSPKCRYALVQGLRRMAHQPFSPRQDTTGFLGSIAEAKWQLPLPSLPRRGDGNGHHLSRPRQGKPPMPRNKKHNQTNGKKNPKNKATNKKPKTLSSPANLTLLKEKDQRPAKSQPGTPDL